MKPMNLTVLGEVFTHVHPRTGALRTFDVKAMYEYASENAGMIECIDIPLDAAFVSFIRQHRGIEQWKLDRLREPFLSRPTLMVDLPDRTQLTVDGHHRWIRRHELGYTTIACYWFRPGQWERFLIERGPSLKPR